MSMWKDYSLGCIKTNRSSGISIAVAAFISALFLSLLCCAFYNAWIYDIESIIINDGDWHARITGQIGEGDIEAIRGFENVESAELNEGLSDAQKSVVDIRMRNARSVFVDVPLIMQTPGLYGSAAEYHHLLLSRYLIHDPEDPEPPLLLALYLAILVVVSASLILIIHNSFAVSMNARVHQFGIFSSVGATPRQIRACLMQEAAALSAAPILLGMSLGIAICYGLVRAVNAYAGDMGGRHQAAFLYHPLVLAATFIACALTVMLSAWLPARKLSRLTPLMAIRGADEPGLKRKRRSRLLSLLFGIEGELAGNALKAQKKALRTSALSLTLSFLGFTVMLCFFTLSGISTDHTYFTRYQDAWDVMATVKNTAAGDIGLARELKALPGVKSAVIYQKAEAVCALPEEFISQELTALGGPEAVAGKAISAEGGDYRIKAQLIILDDGSFDEYRAQTGIAPESGGAIALNRIWDSKNSNFRYKEYIPFVSEGLSEAAINGEALPIAGFAKEPPVLREEYANYTLALFVPETLWRGGAAGIGGAEPDSYIRVLAGERESLAALDEIEYEVSGLLGSSYAFDIENRIREKMTNDDMINGYMMVIGAFCALLAVIGLSNVFSNTMSFIRQRRREFAQYMSVGMTPRGMRRMFAAEALVIAGRPLVITLPLTVVFVGFMISASHLDPVEFLSKAPVVPIAAFIAAIFFFVALAYLIGGRKALAFSLAEALRGDYGS